MDELTAKLLILGICGLVLAVICLDEVRIRRRRRQAVHRLLRQLRSAGLQVDREYRQARREMNERSGQSWRNLAE